MIVTLTCQGTEKDLPTMQKAIGILGETVVTVQETFKRPNGSLDAEADEPVQAKRRGRPRKNAKADAETEMEVEQEEQEEQKPAEDEITDAFMISEVGAFCKKYPSLTVAVSNLCHEFGVDRISSLPPDKRPEFLSQLQTLPTLS